MIGLARGILDVLLASVWQGACVAIAVTVVLALAGRSLNAATRCLVLQGALLVIALIPLFTTLPSVLPQASLGAQFAVAPAPAGDGGRAVQTPQAASRRIEIALSDRAALVLTGVWIAGILVFILRIGGGWLQVARLRRNAQRLDDRGNVRVYASPDIRMPLAFGAAAPTIMVPAALAARAGEELECVILHELAHIRRADAWANACERIFQAFLFFNPAVVFVLRGIALERETACDDLAVAESRDLDGYTRSLASVALWGAEYRAISACGVSGFNHATAVRIRRLEDTRRNGAISTSRFALGGFTIVFVILALLMQSFAPAIAFATDSSVVAGGPIVPGALAKDPCPARVEGPHLPKSMPRGLRTDVVVQVSPEGAIATPVIEKSSGNAAFDHATVVGATQLMTSVGKIRPPRCTTPEPGTYYMSLQSGGTRTEMVHGKRKTISFQYLWRIQAGHAKKPIVLMMNAFRS
jgi:beta-lactamase regulating signal transducer with metallopeptidase domain